MPNPTKSEVMKRAISGLGVHEKPAGSNRTPFNAWFYGRMVTAAWCAIWVCWVLIGAGFKFKKNAGADELGAQLVHSGWKKVKPSAIESGDVVVYNFSHIGLCKAALKNGHKRVFEGNHGDSSTTVDRPISDIRYGVRPPYSPETGVKKPPSKPPVHGGVKFTLTRVLHTGTSGEDVRKLQELLKVKEDTYFGLITRGAVIAFQRNHHLKDDGEVGVNTAHALGWNYK